MITGELKAKVDNIWNTMWSGGISNPLLVIRELHTWVDETKVARDAREIQRTGSATRTGMSVPVGRDRRGRGPHPFHLVGREAPGGIEE